LWSRETRTTTSATASSMPAGRVNAAQTETLVALETEGLVMRMSPMKRRATASWRWAATTTEDESARSAKEPSAAPEPRQRRRPGELRGRVMAFMRAHSGEELSPTAGIYWTPSIR
jgi:hypothetical protein